MRMAKLWLVASIWTAVIGCNKPDAEPVEDGLVGTIRIDGSSTIAPISMAVAELFLEKHPGIKVTVGVSGTGGGFKKFLDEQPSLRTDINDASRPIKPVEIERARELGVEFIELPVALDGIVVVVNPRNDFVNHLTVAELARIWKPGSQVNNWKDVRDGFPDLPLKLYGPGTDSGTFDYFTEAIVGEAKASRGDYTMSEDDNVIVQGVEGDAGALGYFGFAYYGSNRDKLKLLAVGPDAHSAVKPTPAAIRTGAYQPLSRPLLLYVNQASLERPAVAAFMNFYLESASEIVEHPKVNYVALSPEAYQVLARRLEKRITGSVLAAEQPAGPVNVVELYGEAATAGTKPAAGEQVVP